MACELEEVITYSSGRQIISMLRIVLIIYISRSSRWNNECALLELSATQFERVAPTLLHSCRGRCRFLSVATCLMSSWRLLLANHPTRASCLSRRVSPTSVVVSWSSFLYSVSVLNCVHVRLGCSALFECGFIWSLTSSSTICEQ